MSKHSADWIFRDIKVLRFFLIRWWCIELVASIIGKAIRFLEKSLSVKIIWTYPLRTAFSASLLIFSNSFLKEIFPLFFSKVVSIILTLSPIYWRKDLNWFIDKTGEPSWRWSHWSSFSSSMLLKWPIRVLKLITTFSRKLSMGGLVTWLKFWRKKWCSPRYLSVKTARGVSSPIEPTASFCSTIIGWRINSKSSIVHPKAVILFRSSALSTSLKRSSADWTSLSIWVIFLVQLLNGFKDDKYDLRSLSL